MFDIAREQRRHSAILTTLSRRHVYGYGLKSTLSGPQLRHCGLFYYLRVGAGACWRLSLNNDTAFLAYLYVCTGVCGCNSGEVQLETRPRPAMVTCRPLLLVSLCLRRPDAIVGVGARVFQDLRQCTALGPGPPWSQGGGRWTRPPGGLPMPNRGKKGRLHVRNTVGRSCLWESAISALPHRARRTPAKSLIPCTLKQSSSSLLARALSPVQERLCPHFASALFANDAKYWS